MLTDSILDIINYINQRSKTTIKISVLNIIDDYENSEYKFILDNIMIQITSNKKIKYYNNTEINRWIKYETNICILLINEELDEIINIIKMKYDKHNYDNFIILTQRKNYYRLPIILNTTQITKNRALKNLDFIAIIIFSDKMWEFNEYEISYEDKIIVINKLIKYHNLTTQDKLYARQFWKIYCDFDKYYFKLLDLNKYIYNTILYNINIFYRLINFFNLHDIEYRADAGTLLGSIKWNGFICHDIDFDLVMDYTTIKKLKNSVKFDEFIKKYNLILTTKYNKNNNCGILCIDHHTIPLHIDLYGLVKKKTFYGLCHYNLTEEDSEKMYSIKIDEYESKPSMVSFGKIELKAYSKDKIIQYLDRTYFGWKFLVKVRCPNYYESKYFRFLNFFSFIKEGTIDIPIRNKYERKISSSTLFKIEEKLVEHYKKKNVTLTYN